MTDQEKILNLLSDGEYHCPTRELFMKDDRARISGLRKKGYKFDSPVCELCPAGYHSSRVVMRKITFWPTQPVALQNPSQNAPGRAEAPQLDKSYVYPVHQPKLSI